MGEQKFTNLSPLERVEMVNKLLQKENANHLQNVAKKLEMSPSTFSKLLRADGEFQYNQTKKLYEKLLSIDEYKRTATKQEHKKHEETLEFLEEHIEQLKSLLNGRQDELILEQAVYNPKAKSVTKSFQITEDIYDRFMTLTQTHYPHLRQRDLISKALLDFCNRYEKCPSN